MFQELPYSTSNDQSQDALLLEPYSHLLSVQGVEKLIQSIAGKKMWSLIFFLMLGKNVRVKLIAAFNHWLQVLNYIEK